MKVALFCQRFPPALGGSEAYFRRFSRHFLAHGHEVAVFTTTAIDLEAFWSKRGTELPAGEALEEGLRVRRYAPRRWPGRRYFLKALSFFPNHLWRCLTMPCNPVCPGMWRDAGRLQEPFDLVHASAFPYAWPIVCGRRLARRLDVPFVLTPFLHLGDPEDPRDPVRRAYTAPHLTWLLRQADLLFAQTPGERQAMLNLGLPESRVVLQGLGVDPAECTGGDRSRARAAWGCEEADCVVGHLANLSREKGTVDLLQAAERAWNRGSRVRLVLAGPTMANFRAFWNDFSRRTETGRVVLLDRLSEEGKRDFFAGIDVFALPSRSDSFGLVLLEAWANGVPCVGYRAGGVADVIRHEENGLLVRCGDLNGLADSLVRLEEDATRRRAMGEAGRALLPREYRWEDRLNLVLDRCGNLVGRRERTPPA